MGTVNFIRYSSQAVDSCEGEGWREAGTGRIKTVVFCFFELGCCGRGILGFACKGLVIRELLAKAVAMAMVPANPSGDDTEGSYGESGDVIDVGSSESPAALGGPSHPTFCLFKGVADGFAGGLMGSVFGFGSGLFKRQGFKVALREGGTSAKTFALLSGVHSIVSCYLKRLRGKEDAWNAGLAGCATGLALSTPGTPQALAQSCLSFGAFSFVLEYMNNPRAALAATTSEDSLAVPAASRKEGGVNININHLHFHLNLPVLPPFTLPPPLSLAGFFPFADQQGPKPF